MRLRILLFFLPIVLHAVDTFKLGDIIPPDAGITKPIDENNHANLQLRENHFYLYILDKERKVITPPYAGAFVRYRYLSGRKRNKQYTTSLNNDGTLFTSPRVIAPPHHFFFYVRFKKEDGSIIEIPRMEKNINEKI